MSDKGGWLKNAPTGVLVVCFVVLAVVFALADVLDGWARVVLAVVFVAIALALVGRWRQERSSGSASPPVPAPTQTTGQHRPPEPDHAG